MRQVNLFFFFKLNPSICNLQSFFNWCIPQLSAGVPGGFLLSFCNFSQSGLNFCTVGTKHQLIDWELPLSKWINLQKWYCTATFPHFKKGRGSHKQEQVNKNNCWSKSRFIKIYVEGDSCQTKMLVSKKKTTSFTFIGTDSCICQNFLWMDLFLIVLTAFKNQPHLFP